MTSILSGLNDQQRLAVTTTAGPVLILAGAGSGKTRTLTHRIAYLLEQNLAYPSEILALTFTNKAAKEMRERVRGLVKGTHIPDAVGTFHGLGVRILREQAGWHRGSKTFTIIDAKDSERLVREALQRSNISPKQWSPRTVRQAISRLKNDFILPATALTQAQEGAGKIMATAYMEYERLLASHNAFDFDDLLLAPISVLTQNPAIADFYRERWRFLSVDEYQDTNGVQERLLQLLLNKEKNICAVGDDYQAIYSWRGAKVDHILHFEAAYPNCTTIYLTQNYRSTPQILTAANAVIVHNQNQKHKELWTDNKVGQPVALFEVLNERAEARLVRQQIEAHVSSGGKLKDCAILYRTNAQSRVFEEEFLTHRMPYTIVGGFRFYERREIKDALALLTLYVNPKAVLALRRLAESFLEGIGPKTLAKWEQEATQSDVTLLDVARSVGKMQIRRFGQAFISAREHQFETVTDLVRHLLTASGYMEATRALPDGEDRLRNLEELLSVAHVYTDAAKFLEDIALLSDLDTLPEAADRVVCMTLHAAKGLEFPLVFLTGVEDGLLPHRNSWDSHENLEEERRLLYVGMTRAEKFLTLTYVQQRTMAGETTLQSPSRFLQDMPEGVVNMPEETSSGVSFQTMDLLLDNSERQFSPDEEQGILPNQLVFHPSFGQGVVLQQYPGQVTCIFEGFGMQTVPVQSLQLLEVPKLQ